MRRGRRQPVLGVAVGDAVIVEAEGAGCVEGAGPGCTVRRRVECGDTAREAKGLGVWGCGCHIKTCGGEEVEIYDEGEDLGG